tara:strand:+ start:1610 stop:1813 length:204 start_codon:yes stop_codon:yes gene_type:complete
MNKKKPNKVVSEVEGHEEDENPYEFQDNVLTCLADLQRLATTMKSKAISMEEEIRRFRTSIHGEDVG